MCMVILAAGSLAACNPGQRAQQAKNEIDNGNAAACVSERMIIQKAVEAYVLLNPDKPITEAALVTAGIVHSESKLMDVMADGSVVPAPGSVCL
jgi:hypothetical protein